MPAQNGEPVDLKNLLSKWKLECILSHLLVEKIDIDVLEMMKISHIRLLLHNFPLGIQIRFEYYLERWREKIGKPFKLSSSDDAQSFLAKGPNKVKEMENRSTQTDFTSNGNENDIDAEVSCTKIQNNIQLSTKQLPLDGFSTIQAIEEIDLLTILKNTSYGIRLINSYAQRHSFTDKERKLLIETIVDHYINNKLKFNLQISYALEQAILKMFPSEKLSSYRNAIIGKLFITYVNFRKNERTKTKEQRKTENILNGLNDIRNQIIVSNDSDKMDPLCDDLVMVQANNTAEIDIVDISQNDDANDETITSDNTESIIFTVDNSDEEDEANKTGKKTNSEEFVNTATFNSEIFIHKMRSQKRQRIEEIDLPFVNFRIPWDKMPEDLICALESGVPQLGKGLNMFANIVVDELRKVSTKVPVHVLRAISQQAAMKYPHSFLEKDEEGNLQPSTKSSLLSTLRNRNTFLNRQTR